MLKTILIDDEQKDIEVLQKLLEKHCGNVEVLATANNVKKAQTLLSTMSPDLVFLDIEMPNATGFELLSRLKAINFEVIFTTALEKYAVKAFKHNALDYLLKPIDAGELVAAVAKCEEKKKHKTTGNINIRELLSAFEQPAKSTRVSVPMHDEILYIESGEIIRLEGDSNYTHIYLMGGKKITSSKTIKDYEEILSGMKFFRIHKTHIINLKHAKKYTKGTGGSITMIDDTTLEVSKYRKNELMEALSQ
jgi:two-component system, LytTR family, response regulator